MKCKTCQWPISDWKCDICGAEAPQHVADHSCGGDHCLPKCQGCGQAETKCTCKA